MDLLSPGLFGQKAMVFEEHHLASVMGNVGVEVLSMHCMVLLMELASRNAADTAIPALGTLLLTLQNVKPEKYYEDNRLHRPARGYQSHTSACRAVEKGKPTAAKDKAPTIRILC